MKNLKVLREQLSNISFKKLFKPKINISAISLAIFYYIALQVKSLFVSSNMKEACKRCLEIQTEDFSKYHIYSSISRIFLYQNIAQKV